MEKIKKFEEIKQHCKATSKFTPIIDNFLIYYAVQKDQLEKKMDQKMKPYRHIIRNIEPAYINFLKSEYIASQILKKNGLLRKYLQHSAIKALRPAEHQYLVDQYEHPWRFSFAQVIDNPAEDFFQMLDVFTGEQYLLYSPGTKNTLSDHPVHLWFNLIAFNGKCWQTYGLIIGFCSFTVDDIFFFATELYPELEDENDLMLAVEKNPWPFFMLLSNATTPFLTSHGHLMNYHTGIEEIAAFPFDQLKETFKVQWNDGIYELQLDPWSAPPHFAKAYYDESKGTLFRFSYTAEGFVQLNRHLQQKGIFVEPEPDIMVTPNMLITAGDILRREIILDPYEEQFASTNEVNNEELDSINQLLQQLIPKINNKEPIDIEKLAIEAGVDLETAKSLLATIQAKLKDL